MAPLLQLNMYGVVPPVTAMLTAPFAAVLQVTCVAEPVTPSAAGCATVALNVALHKLASITVTEYTPAGTPLIS